MRSPLQYTRLFSIPILLIDSAFHLANVGMHPSTGQVCYHRHVQIPNFEGFKKDAYVTFKYFALRYQK